MNILGRETHPDADRFPMMQGARWAAFLRDVKENGLLHRELWEDKQGLILDGRNRARACEILGIEPVWRVYEGDNPDEFVRSQNLHRRNMNGSILALVAASFATRQRGRPSKKAPRTELPEPTEAELAAEYDISESELKRGKVVLKNGIPELLEAVQDEAIPISRAAEIAQLPRDRQLAELAKDKPETRDKLQRQRAQNSNEKLPPGKFLLATAVRAFVKLGATIETLEENRLLVRFDDETFELQLQLAQQTGRAA
jgi:hypothetical protein